MERGLILLKNCKRKGKKTREKSDELSQNSFGKCDELVQNSLGKCDKTG